MRVQIKTLNNKNGVEVGSVLKTSLNRATTEKEKKVIEEQLKQYAHDVLYPEEGLLIYSEYYDDTASIIVLTGTESLQENNVVI